MDVTKIQEEIQTIKDGLKIEGVQLEKESEYFMYGYTKEKDVIENIKQGVYSYIYREPLETLRVERHLETQLQNTRRQNKEENTTKYEAYLEYMVCSQKVLTLDERTIYERMKVANTFRIEKEPLEIVYYKLGEVYALNDAEILQKYITQIGVDPRVVELAGKIK